MATLADVGERQAIHLVQKILGRRGREGAKLDDAAVVRLHRAEQHDIVATTDTVTYALHKFPGTPARHFGYFACAASISDLAAMGARPKGMLLALGLPSDMAVGELEDLALGFRDAAHALSFDVWGGDLKQADAPFITGAAFGVVPRGRALARARSASPGWTVAVTGFLGRAAFGASLAARGDARGFDLIYTFTPRVREGLAAAALSRRIACIDSSDGLAASLAHLAAANPGVGFEVDWQGLPLHPGLTRAVGPDRIEEVALQWGGDYELVLAAPPKVFAALAKALARWQTPLTAIGRTVTTPGVFLRRDGKTREVSAQGFEHFRSKAGWNV